jgi:hypothetical protein
MEFGGGRLGFPVVGLGTPDHHGCPTGPWQPEASGKSIFLIWTHMINEALTNLLGYSFVRFR